MDNMSSESHRERFSNSTQKLAAAGDHIATTRDLIDDMTRTGEGVLGELDRQEEVLKRSQARVRRRNGARCSPIAHHLTRECVFAPIGRQPRREDDRSEPSDAPNLAASDMGQGGARGRDSVDAGRHRLDTVPQVLLLALPWPLVSESERV